MEMVPRRRGRPRKAAYFSPTAEVKPDTATIDTDKLAEVSAKIAALETEKAELQKKLERIEQADKTITSEQLVARNILTQDEKAKVEKQLRYCDLMLQGQNEVMSSAEGVSVVSRSDLIQDKDQLKRQKMKAEYILKAGATPELNAREETRLAARKKELEGIIRDRRSSIGDEWDNRDSYEFHRTVKNKVRYMEECTVLEMELKNINRILNPEDSDAGNLGYLSPKRIRNA